MPDQFGISNFTNTGGYGISNPNSNAGIYNSLAGGAIPSATTYGTAAANSNNGVNFSNVLGGVTDRKSVV